MYRPSGDDARGSEQVTSRFVRRFGDKPCGASRNIGFETLGKSIFCVSSVLEFLRPEEYSLAGGERVLQHPETAGHMGLNHDMTKSREEF